MAFVDNRGLVGRPSLRRALAGLDSEQEQRFGALTADIDPPCFVTIIGIPFAIQHLKLAGIALAPVGKTIVDKRVAAVARGELAQDELARNGKR